MTRQQSDTVSFRGEDYILIDRKPLFNPRKHGCEPLYVASSLGRGYVISYKIEHDRLMLSSLTMTLSLQSNPGKLLSAEPERALCFPEADWAFFTYKLSEPILYSGSLVLGREAIAELDEYGYCAGQPWVPEICKCKSVVMLRLSKGHILEVVDLSEQMTRLRKATLRRWWRPWQSEAAALAILENAIGPDNPYRAINLHFLAMRYLDNKNYVGAERIFRQALSLEEAALKNNIQDGADAAISLENYKMLLFNYAGLLRETNRHAEAEKSAAQSNDIVLEIRMYS